MASISTRNSERASPMTMAAVIAGGLGRWPHEVYAASHERRLEVCQELFGLSPDVTLSTILPVESMVILPSDVDRPRRAGHDEHVGEGVAFVFDFMLAKQIVPSERKK